MASLLSRLSNLKCVGLFLISLMSLRLLAAPMTLVMDAREAQQTESPWHVSALYDLKSDFNDPKRPRQFDHSLSLDVSREVFRDYLASVNFGVSFSSLNDAIVRDQKGDSYFPWKDINLSLTRDFTTQDLQQKTTLTLGEDILISEESRFLGYRSVTSGDAVHDWRPLAWISVRNILSGGYVLNTYKYSPVSLGQISQGQIMADGYYIYGLNPAVKFLKKWRAGVTLGTRGTHYMDGTTQFRINNNYSIGYFDSHWSARLQYINRGHADRGETNLWFVDEYRQFASLGLGYNF